MTDEIRPKTIDEAVRMLLGFDGANSFRDESPASYHHHTGRWMRNNWGLWDENSQLHKEFKSIGIHHADDMSGILLVTTHRILNGRPVELKKQVEGYQLYWKYVKEEGVCHISVLDCD